MTETSFKLYKAIRATAAPVPQFQDRSGWGMRLGFSLHDGLRHALSQIETDPVRLEKICKLTHGYVSYLAATNDLYTESKDGYQAAISFRKNNNPGNKGEARLAVRTPDNRVVFVTFVGKGSIQFQGFGHPHKGFNYWWWKKHAQSWVDRVAAISEGAPREDLRKLGERSPRIILPGEFWDHIDKTPATIIELMTDAVTRAYYANRHDPTIALPWFQKNHRKTLRKKILNTLMASLESKLKQALREQLSAWLEAAQLNSDTAQRHLLRHPDSYGVVRYFSECTADICERRTLFAKTFPFMMPILSRSTWFLRKTHLDATLREKVFSDCARDWLSIVDVGEKFANRAAHDLSTHFRANVTPALVKRFASVGVELATDENIILVLSNLPHIANLPIHHVPTDQYDFIHLTNGIARCRPLLDLMGQNMKTVVKHAGKDLSSELIKIGEHSSSANHLKDYVEAVLGKIILAWAARYATEGGKELDLHLSKSCSELAVDSILQKAVQSRSALRLIEASQRWHKDGHQQNFINRNQTFRHAAEGSTDWPPLTQPVEAPNRYKLVPLTSNLDLQEEGKILGHCVGGYGWQCISNNSHIISVQDENGSHISTLQIYDKIPLHGEIEYEKDLVRSVQHKARGNTTPPQAGLDAAKWYVEKICDGKIDLNLGAIRKARIEMDKTRARNLVSQKIGYDPQQVDKADELYEICRDFLPPGWPKPTLDDMVRTFGIIEPIKDKIANIPVTLFDIPQRQSSTFRPEIGLA